MLTFEEVREKSGNRLIEEYGIDFVRDNIDIITACSIERGDEVQTNFAIVKDRKRKKFDMADIVESDMEILLSVIVNRRTEEVRAELGN